MSLGRVAAGGVGITALGRGFSYLAQILATMVLARVVAVEAFGVIAVCLSLIHI